LLFQAHVVELLQSDMGLEWEKSMLEVDDESLQADDSFPHGSDQGHGIEDLIIHPESDDSDLHDDSDFTV